MVCCCPTYVVDRTVSWLEKHVRYRFHGAIETIEYQLQSHLFTLFNSFANTSRVITIRSIWGPCLYMTRYYYFGAFVKENHQSLIGSAHRGTVIRRFGDWFLLPSTNSWPINKYAGKECAYRFHVAFEAIEYQFQFHLFTCLMFLQAMRTIICDSYI